MRKVSLILDFRRPFHGEGPTAVQNKLFCQTISPNVRSPVPMSDRKSQCQITSPIVRARVQVSDHKSQRQIISSIRCAKNMSPHVGRGLKRNEVEGTKLKGGSPEAGEACQALSILLLAHSYASLTSEGRGLTHASSCLHSERVRVSLLIDILSRVNHKGLHDG